MTDVRQQLTEALDEAGRIAKAAIEGNGWNGEPLAGRWYSEGSGHGWIVTDESSQPIVFDEGEPTEARAAHIARWDPATVLRLVEYFRTLLADHAPDQLTDDVFQCDRCGHFSPCPDVVAAAAFWVGTPEAECLVSIDIAPDSHIHVCGVRGAHTDHQCRQCRMAWSRTTGTPEVDR